MKKRLPILASASASLLVTLAASASPVIGTWVHNAGINDDSDALVFLPNGTYYHIEDNNGNADTFEKGTYSYNEETSQLSFTRLTATGSPDDYLPASISFPVNGNSAQDGEFDRIISPTNPLIGGFEFGNGAPDASGVLILLEGGVYFFAQDTGNDSDTGQDGMERGTYTYNATTGAFTATVTDDTNGDIGLSDPEGPARVSVFGDQLIYKPGTLSFFLNRVTDSPVGSSALDQSQTVMASAGGNVGVMLQTEPGVFYTVERTETPGGPAFAQATLEGTGTMSGMVLEADPASTPKAFFTTFAEPQSAIASADIADFLDSRVIRRRVFSSDGTWAGNGQTGTWQYQVTAASTGSLSLRTDGLDSLANRDEVELDFIPNGELSDITAFETIVRSSAVIGQQSYPLDLGEPTYAPSLEAFRAFLDGRTIGDTVFSNNGRFIFEGNAPGNWSVEAVTANSLRLVQTYDEDGNNGSVYREESIITFDESGQASVSFTEYDNNAVTATDSFALNYGDPVTLDDGSGGTALTFAEFSALYSGKSIAGYRFSAPGRYDSLGENGLGGGVWGYGVGGPNTAFIVFTFDENGNDGTESRDQIQLDFGSDGDLTTVEATLQFIENNQVDESDSFTLDLTTSSFAPRVIWLKEIIAGRTINDTAFGENGRFIYEGAAGGNWILTPVNGNQVLLTQTYDEDGNNPAVYREESLLTFDGTTTVALRYREYDGGSLAVEANTTIILD